MRAAIQRVASSSVQVDGVKIAEIGRGLLVYVGVAPGDGDDDVRYLADKIRHLRVFQDADGKMNLDIAQAGGSVLVVSAFSLLADARKGRRPAFDGAAPPELANRLYEQLCDVLSTQIPVQKGRFAAMMQVASINDGPIHILLDSRKLF